MPPCNEILLSSKKEGINAITWRTLNALCNRKYVKYEFPPIQAGFRKGRGIRDQIANIHWVIKKAREFQKNIYFCFIDYGKAFDCVITINCGKF